MRPLAGLLLAAAALHAAVTPAEAGAITPLTAAPAGTSLSPNQPANLFPIGVFLQPVSTFDTWKSRGVNTVVDFWPGQQSLEVWNAAAVSRGLYMIRAPRANPADDKNEKYLLAWSQHDEPDINGIAPATLAANYAAMKAANPKMPVYLNVSGANVLWPYGTLNKALYDQMLPSSDWTANDVYPVTGYANPDWIDLKKPVQAPINMRWNPGTAVDQLRSWTGGKKQFAYIETSFQNLSSSSAAGARGVTPDELRGEVWDSIIHGAKGVVYFPQKIGGFDHDATPANVAAEITRQDATINALGGVLNAGSDSDPQRVTLTSAGDVDGQSIEATWRSFGGHRYFIVLNFSHTEVDDVKLTLPGFSGLSAADVYGESRSVVLRDGSFTDDFGAYGLHIYTDTGLSLSSLSGLSLAPDGTLVGVGAPRVPSVPEPTGVLAVVAIAGACAGGRRCRRPIER